MPTPRRNPGRAADAVQATALPGSRWPCRTRTTRHDIFDSDDYFQFHGGMIAAIRALIGENPAAYFGDTANPDTSGPRPGRRGPAACSARGWSTPSGSPRSCARVKGGRSSWPPPSTTCSATRPRAVDRRLDVRGPGPGLPARPRGPGVPPENNPWALRSMAERLLEAVDRGMWERPGPRGRSRP